MKIVHINYSDQIGGAATSVMRLHKSLLQKNINSQLLVKEQTTNEKNIISKKSTFSKIIDLLKKGFLRTVKKLIKSNNKSTFSMNYLKGISAKQINNLKPNLVNLHWVSNEMISLKDISKIKYPIVWTLVDMWLFCGGEHYTNEKRFLKGYYNYNRNINEKGFDLNKFVWNLKKKFIKKRIVIVCISNWLSNQAKKSYLLKDFDIRVINCAIDTNKWKPIKKLIAKKILGLDPKKKIILFGATGGTSDVRKGFDYLKKALGQKILMNKEFDLMIFGEQRNQDLNIQNRNIIFQNGSYYGNEIALRTIYSAADLIVAPSTLEAFGQVASEAGSCETPCIAFTNTGFEDVILHKETGFLAKYRNYVDLAEGISWCLKNSSKLNLGKNARRYVVKKFSSNVIASKYIELYKELI